MPPRTWLPLASGLWMTLPLLPACGNAPMFPQEPPPLGSLLGDDTSTPDDEPPCSEDLGGNLVFSIENKASVELGLHWRDRACVETLYQTIPSGASSSQGSFVGHIWTARDAGGALLDWYRVEAAETWIVEDP